MSYGLADVTLGALTLKQCSNMDLNNGLDILVERGSGNVAPDDHFVNAGAPVATFTTSDLATVLAANSAAFLNSGLSVSSGTITLPLRIRSGGATYVSGTNNTTIDATDGLIIPQSITIPGNNKATMTLAANLASGDGITAPTSLTTNATISNGSFNAIYRLHPCTVNGSAVSGISSVTVNPNITIESDSDLDGNVYPTEFVITQAEPSIDLNFKDEAAYETYGSLFTAQSACVINLRKMSPGGTVVATSTAEHITITGGDGLIAVESIGNSEGSRGEYTIRLHCESLTVSTTATL